jgi:DNA-binding transcriptional ArsR family regulator
MDENKLQAESNQRLILEALFENDSLRFKDLQEITGLTPPTLTKNLKSMEASGILRKGRHAGERWPYYTLASPEYIKELMLPQFFWVILDENYPDGTSLENIAANFGEMLVNIIFKERKGNRNHELAIKGLIEIMRNSVDKWTKNGVTMDSPDFDLLYSTFIEASRTPEELRRMGDELFQKRERETQPEE